MTTEDAAPRREGSAPPVDGSGEGAACARGTYLDGRCYFTTGIGSMDYDTAKGLCTAAGAEPASIHSAAANKLIFDMMLKIRDGVWIGLVRDGSAFAWEDGSALDYTNWADGEPDDDDCVVMVGPWGDQSRQAQWADTRCSRSYEEIICQTRP